MKKKEYNNVLNNIINANNHKIRTIQHIIPKKIYIKIQERLLTEFQDISIKILKDIVILNISNISSEPEEDTTQNIDITN
ncbi:MAG: hypothetical protein Q8K70_12455 [Bacteroidota bacterium]|nr:hypothetical protein [Bacteroidota bacterium]